MERTAFILPLWKCLRVPLWTACLRPGPRERGDLIGPCGSFWGKEIPLSYLGADLRASPWLKHAFLGSPHSLRYTRATFLFPFSVAVSSGGTDNRGLITAAFWEPAVFELGDRIGDVCAFLHDLSDSYFRFNEFKLWKSREAVWSAVLLGGGANKVN